MDALANLVVEKFPEEAWKINLADDDQLLDLVASLLDRLFRLEN